MTALPIGSHCARISLPSTWDSSASAWTTFEMRYGRGSTVGPAQSESLTGSGLSSGLANASGSLRMNTDPFDATITLPTETSSLKIPQVPNLAMAMWPSTMARDSRTTKSIIGVPMPVLIMLMGTPNLRPVNTVNPRALVVSNTSPPATAGSSSPDSIRARPVSPTERIRLATSPRFTPKWYTRPSLSVGKFASVNCALPGTTDFFDSSLVSMLVVAQDAALNPSGL
mmetsp:Transcript_34023/g.74427  ORF Transcript_34023/g.74427 Transcript_34023/m.74427 type:complete len:227 (+) Transcript_34023:549-1229(+)